MAERRSTILGQYRRTVTKNVSGLADGPIRRRKMNTRSTGTNSLATALHSPRLCSSPLTRARTSASIQTPLYESEDFDSDRHEADANSISYNMRDSYENEFHRKISNMIVLHGIQV